MQGNRIFGLDLLRAIAITLVVASHCTFIFFEETNNPILLSIRSLGAIGVDLFFVLSGFLIGGILLRQFNKNKISFKHLLWFWKRRWFRTLPNYFLVLIVNILIIVSIGESLPSKTLLYFPFLQNFTSPHPDFFTEAWSLSIEEYSYLILPFMLYSTLYFLNLKYPKHKVFIWTTIALILIQLLFKVKYYLEVNVESYKDWSSTFRKVVIYRLDVIYYGFILVYFYSIRTDFFNKYSRLFFVFSLLLFIFTHLFIYMFEVVPQTHLAFYVFEYLPIIAICCGFVFPFVMKLNPINSFQKIIYFISTRSYAIYLINYSIILLNLKRILNFDTMSILMKFMVVLIFLILTLGISDLLYRYFEKPILNYRDRKYLNSK